MKDKRFWITIALTGIAMNGLDFVFQGYLFAGPIYERYSGVFRQDPSVMPFYVLGDFLAVLVMLWVYLRVRGSFMPGIKGGALFGFYAGVLISFPYQHMTQLTIEGYPYWVAWVLTLYGIVWGTIAGALIGRLMQPGESKGV